ncbi:MAG: hypothetical protein HKO57_17020 [Akkermansiaceae bacterium]|nr:hypothetical protein [Akkermansiaceae bacterium]
MGIQVLTGIGWTLPLLHGTGEGHGYMALTLLVCTAAFFWIPAFFAIYSLWSWDDSRPRSFAVLAAPFVLVPLPFILRYLAGGPVIRTDAGTWGAVLGVLVLGMIALLVFPRYFAGFIPRWLLRNRGLNVLLLLVQTVPISAPVVMAAVHGPAAFEGPADNQAGWAILYGLLAYAIFCWVATAIDLVAFFFAYLALFSGPRRRFFKLHIAQIVLALLVFAPAFLLTWFLRGTVDMNPFELLQLWI